MDTALSTDQDSGPASWASASSQDSTASSSGAIGYVVVHGTNGKLVGGDKGRKRSKYELHNRREGNGLKPSKHYTIPTTGSASQTKSSDAVQHTITFDMGGNKTAIVEYESDPDTDLYQFGRGSEKNIDLVVMDTTPGSKISKLRCAPPGQQKQSTISRFACRILVSRNKAPPEVSVYASGFDTSNNIFLGEKALKWETETGVDGLTTNGVLIMNIKGDFIGGDATPELWREVSIRGELYTLRETRSATQKGVKVKNETNKLHDGSMIDLCGVTLLWRTPDSISRGPSRSDLEQMVVQLRGRSLRCPVTKVPLIWTLRSTLPPPNQTPHINLNCGHVHGMHEWFKSGDERRCPLCQEVGPIVQLIMGMEPAFWVDTEPPTHAFNPCGHMASEKTIKYWAKIPLPHGTNGFIAACPFCATALVDYPGYATLNFVENVAA